MVPCHALEDTEPRVAPLPAHQQHGYDATNACGIRPALYFTSDLLVSIEDEGEEDAAADETALYREYRAYVKDWLEGNADTGKSPLSYEDWKAD